MGGSEGGSVFTGIAVTGGGGLARSLSRLQTWVIKEFQVLGGRCLEGKKSDPIDGVRCLGFLCAQLGPARPSLETLLLNSGLWLVTDQKKPHRATQSRATRRR